MAFQPSRSKVVEYSVRLKEILHHEGQAGVGSEVLEENIEGCFELVEKIAADVGPYGELLRTILSVLQTAIYRYVLRDLKSRIY